MTTDPDDRPGQVGDWTPPPLDEWYEHQYDTPVGDPGDILRFRHCWDWQDCLVDFAVILMSNCGGTQLRVAVADICHGELHVHVYNQQGEKIHRESIWPVDTQVDVQRSYDAALDRMMENWGLYKRRWRYG